MDLPCYLQTVVQDALRAIQLQFAKTAVGLVIRAYFSSLRLELRSLEEKLAWTLCGPTVQLTRHAHVAEVLGAFQVRDEVAVASTVRVFAAAADVVDL